MKPRAVFDCMVLLQAAARKAGPAAACLQLAKTGVIELFLSVEVCAELKDVMTRPRTKRKFPELTEVAVQTFLSEAGALATQISDVPCVFDLERDPKDSKYLNLAIAADAQFLVSRDKDLLELNFEEAFRQQFPKLTILDPVAFLRNLAGNR